MNMRFSIAIIAALALGCGAAQDPLGPGQETVVDGTFPPPLEQQRRPDKQGRCTLPKGWLPASARVIIRNGACWGEIEATETECREAAKTNPYNVWHEGRCWYWLYGRGKEPQPTSSSGEPLSPVTT
jgi:hypothetical protein